MDEPETGIHSSADERPLRSARALTAGVTVSLTDDLPIRVAATDADKTEAIRSMLGDLPPDPRPAAFEIVYRDEPQELPEREPDETYSDLVLWREGDSLLLRHKSGITACATHEGFTAAGAGEAVRIAFRRLFQPAITHVLGYRDMFVVHGGGLVRDDRAVLLLGATGKGKSTLVAAAAKDGWRILSDDLVILQRGPEGLLIAGIPKTVAVPSELGVEIQGARRLPNDPRERDELPSHILTRGWHPLRAVLRVGHGSDLESEVEPFKGPALLHFVIGSFPSAGNGDLLQRFYPVAGAASRLPGWTLFHSRDLDRRLESSARALDGVYATL
jgi:hypothetical protein